MKKCALVLAVALAGALWQRPATACSRREPQLSMPGPEDRRSDPYPANTRLFTWHMGGSHPKLQLTSASGQAVRGVRRVTQSCTEMVPVDGLRPGSYVLGDADPQGPALTIEGASDLSPPKLVSVARPRVTTSPGGMCTSWRSTFFKVRVEDDSPVVIVVWGGETSAPDPSLEPVWVARIAEGGVAVGESVDPGHPAPRNRRWALMAIDVAGNSSDVVFVPGTVRTRAALFANTKEEKVGPLGPAPALDQVHTADPVEPAAPPQPVAPLSPPPPPPASKPRGCGCDLPGRADDAPSFASWVAALFVGAIVARRVQRS